jgi:hypothetical protein
MKYRLSTSFCLAILAAGLPLVPVTGAQPLPEMRFELAVLEDGTAAPAWTEGIALGIGEDAARALEQESMPLSVEAQAWVPIVEGAMPALSGRAAELTRILDVPVLDATVVVGNRGSSDAIGWMPDFIGVNVQAVADAYGPLAEGAQDRIVRIAAHEYIHLLTYRHYPDHGARRQTPFDRALWTIFFEGIGDYVSASGRWHPDESGDYSPVTAETLARLEPEFVARLEMLARADEGEERALRAGISMGKFDEKWGSLPYALWLLSEAKRCGEPATLRAALALERDSVLALAARYAADSFEERIRALAVLSGRADSLAETDSCLAELIH